MYPELNNYKKINEISNLEVANFGTGFGYYDFQYDDFNINAFNFSLLQQSLEFDYKLMNHYRDKFKLGCKMCIVLPFFIFCADYLKDVEQINERYYSVLPKELVQGSCCTTYDEYLEKIESKGIEDVKPELKIPLTYVEMQVQTQAALDDWKRKLKIYSFQSGTLSADVKNSMIGTKKWLRKILSFCRNERLEPIVIVPPMSQTLLDKISQEFRNTHYYKVLDEMLDKDIMILDYTNSKEFCRPELYGWPGFLIQDAAKEFTKDVLTKIDVKLSGRERML